MRSCIFSYIFPCMLFLEVCGLQVASLAQVVADAGVSDKDLAMLVRMSESLVVKEEKPKKGKSKK